MLHFVLAYSPVRFVATMKTLFGIVALISLVASAIAATLNDPSGYAGGWGPWGPFCKCSKSCGGGTQYRLRVCANPPVYGKIPPCEGSDRHTQDCGTHPCPVDGYCEAYGGWGACSKTCGGGTCKRTRKCYPPKYGGKTYVGYPEETKKCGTHPCPVNGYCDAYGSWSKCTKTCGGGTCTRTRKCYPPKYGGKAYVGYPEETKKCGTHPCPVDGYCDAYGSWSKCTKTCGGGTCTRTRKCYPPKYGGKAYVGYPEETKKCGTHPCPVDGYCDAYGSWSKCTKTCGGGTCTRTRKCYPPKYGGKAYVGYPEETKKCGTHPCPVDGYCDPYSSWTKCSKTCGGGFRTRSRKCYPPKYGGKPCPKPSEETQSCGTHPCPVNGGYSSWSSWTSCSKTCGRGHCSRSRACINPRPLYGGKPCSGDAKETGSCYIVPCPYPGGNPYGPPPAYDEGEE
ncbi:coadhesin-like isoform X12 [Actinia tenebrosa]|uniref:Coadhesin-like isoform X12 n=1 Tax=Actinia tenebrosa TaxID=6105 RepID=A0A6P8IT59_ACTTE|nr:coadhesin-like isoform X8 [Actinia tenebrosa]XP_031569455.1 coadhesin-like isoform X12 [Actinia tenebrosa]